MAKRNPKTEPAPAPAPKAEQAAPVQLVTLSAKGKVHQFRPGSQRDVWFRSLKGYEGKPLADWLAAVAKDIPMQRQKEGHKSSHKGGGGFLRRFAREGLLAWRSE